VSAPLYQITSQHRELQRLAEETDIDGQIIVDTLEGLIGDFDERANAIGMVVGNLESSADAIAEAAKAMAARAARLRERARGIRTYLKINMEACGFTKISSPYFVISLRMNPPRVDIVDEAAIPDEFREWPEPPPPSIDRRKLLDALKEGRVIPGASIAQDSRIEIRT
jgi:hypothetical protein